MKIVTLKPEQFDDYTKKHKYRNYYQTTSYGNTMIDFGYNVHYLGILDDNEIIIGASLILYKEVFMGNKIAYAPRGLLFEYNNKEQLITLATKLKSLLGKQGFMLLKIDPYIISTIRDNKGNIINFNNETNVIQANLESTDFKYKGKSLYFEDEKPRWEALTLLNRDIDTLFKQLSKRTRHKINKAIKSGIEVSIDKNIKDTYDFIKTKTKKPLSYYEKIINEYNSNVFIAKINTEAFIINSRKLYENEMTKNDILAQKIQTPTKKGIAKKSVLNSKMESDKLLNIYKNNLILATKLLKDNPNGLIIGGAITIDYDNATYLVADGFNKEYSFINPSYLIKWSIITNAKNKNYKYVNFNGISGNFENTNKYKNLNEMKLGFNSIITEYIGEFDIILNNFTYSLYKSFNKNKK